MRFEEAEPTGEGDDGFVFGDHTSGRGLDLLELESDVQTRTGSYMSIPAECSKNILFTSEVS